MTQLKANIREAQGTGANRRLRREGFIPAVVYGDNQEPLSISVEHNAVFYELQKEKFHTTVLDLEIDGKNYPVLVRDFQMHPFKNAVQHIDFQVVDLEKPVRVKIPLHFVNGEVSPAVKLHGGRIARLATSVELLIKPKAIPEFLELDLKDLVGGQIMHISDIALPEGAVSVALKRGANPAVVSATGKARA